MQHYVRDADMCVEAFDTEAQARLYAAATDGDYMVRLADVVAGVDATADASYVEALRGRFLMPFSLSRKAVLAALCARGVLVYGDELPVACTAYRRKIAELIGVRGS